STNLYRKYNDLKTGQQIKDFTLLTVEGDTQKLSDLRGKYLLLDFWFVGCSYCIKAMPAKSKLKRELTNFDIVSIDPVDDLERMNSWVRKKNYNWTFLNAKGNKSLLDYFTIDGYPTYFLISPTGELLYQSKEFELSNIYKQIVSIVKRDQ
ncbi:MAG: TlpA family protein disulfide reductase, partial [Bacteroidetes bacterium]|nr:TlpA family protein disulfide reductase [Bacteroidota bacterium]